MGIQYRNRVAYLVELLMTNVQFYEVTDLLLSRLTASEVSLVAHLLGISDHFIDRDKYLSPLRDIDPALKFFNPLFQAHHRILILGQGVQDLVERIQRPADYWSRHVEAISQDEDPCLPRIWILCIPPDAASHTNSMKRMSFAQAQEIFQTKVMIQARSCDIKFRGPRSASRIVWQNGMGIYRRIFEPVFDAWQEHHMCSIGGICFPIDWDDIYDDISSSSVLPYIELANDTNDSHTIKYSGKDRAMNRQLDTLKSDGKVVLWKKNYCLRPNSLFNGRVILDNGEVMDEIEYAFMF
ncbi:unnamed protein product [Penicillium pancosmium]